MFPEFVLLFYRLPKSIENKIQSLVNGVKARFKVHEVVRTPKVDERGQTSASIPVNTTHGLTDSISEETESPLFSELSIAEEKSFVKRTLKSIFANNFPKQEGNLLFSKINLKLRSVCETVYILALLVLELNEFVKTCTDREENPSNIVNDFKDIISNVRSKYLDRNPDLFNWWMEIFKGFSYKKEGLIGELWDVVVTGVVFFFYTALQFIFLHQT